MEQDRYYSETIEIDSLDFKKIKLLYGTLKGFKRPYNYFTIESKDRLFRLQTTSFMALLSLYGLKESITITLVSKYANEIALTKEILKNA